MRKKLISLLLTGVLTALLLAGCGSTDNSNSAASENTAAAEETASAGEDQEAVDLAGAETTEEAVEITYANFNASGGNEETLQKMVEAFEATHENIKIEVETIGYDDADKSSRRYCTGLL